MAEKSGLGGILARYGHFSLREKAERGLISEADTLSLGEWVGLLDIEFPDSSPFPERSSWFSPLFEAIKAGDLISLDNPAWVEIRNDEGEVIARKAREYYPAIRAEARALKSWLEACGFDMAGNPYLRGIFGIVTQTLQERTPESWGPDEIEGFRKGFFPGIQRERSERVSAMVQATFDFVRSHGKYPTPQQIWERLNQEPPAGFRIQPGNGRVSINGQALTRGAFLTLWDEKRAQPEGADPA